MVRAATWSRPAVGRCARAIANRRYASRRGPSWRRSDGYCDSHVLWRMLIRSVSVAPYVEVGDFQWFGWLAAIAAARDSHAWRGADNVMVAGVRWNIDNR